MGSGKTTVSKILSSKLKIPFIDTDQLIEKRTHKTITDIFTIWGEPKFRKLEEQVLSSLVDHPLSVIALGGGAVLSETNRNTIKKLGISIYLKWSPETLYKRLQQCHDRPLLQQVKPQCLFSHISSMLTVRNKYYEQADIIVNGDNFSDFNDLADGIITKIECEYEKH